MNIRTAIASSTSYHAPLWAALDDDFEAPIETLQAGDLVEWENYEETEIGVGIIKTFAKSRFYSYDKGRYITLKCAYVVNANPKDPYGYYIPLTHLDTLTMSDYMAIYKDEYDANEQEVSELFDAVITRRKGLGWRYGYSDVSELWQGTDIVQGEFSYNEGELSVAKTSSVGA